jgi:hypothetical protein
MEEKQNLHMLSSLRLSLDPEWIKFLPQIHIHVKEPFNPISIEHLLKCSQLCIRHKGKIINKENPDIYTINELYRNGVNTQDIWRDLTLSWLEVSDFDHLNQYQYWPDTPIYIRVVQEEEDKITLKCMYIMSASQSRHCCCLWSVWSKIKPIHVLTFDIVLCQSPKPDTKWQLYSLGWWHEKDEKYDYKLATDLTFSDETHPNLFMMCKSHELKHETSSWFSYHARWKPMGQFIDTESKEKEICFRSRSSWCKISNFLPFQNLL